MHQRNDIWLSIIIIQHISIGKRGQKKGLNEVKIEVYQVFIKIQWKTETNPVPVLHQAIHGVTLDISINASYVSLSTHQVPIETRSKQGKSLAIH